MSVEKQLAVGVFLSAKDLGPKYTEPAVEIGELLVKNGYTFVYGGSEVGLMKVVADVVDEAGGKIIAVTTQLFKDICRKNVTEAVSTDSIAERKKVMIEKSDAVVALSGGTGTLDEITEIIELKKNNLHDKPIIFLNSDGFWNGLQTQLQMMEKEGFLFKPLDDLVYFAPTPKDVITYLQTYFSKV